MLRRCTTRGGFTLIELLVAVAVIALLLAILLPVLGRARQTSRTILCGNNLRTLVLATTLYVHDNRAVFPRPLQGTTAQALAALSSAQRGSALWFNAVDRYLGQALHVYDATITAERSYVELKHDPVWKEPVIVTSSGGQQGNQTLKMNSEFCDDSNNRFFTREGDLRRSGPIVLYVDGKAQDNPAVAGLLPGNFDASPGEVSLRHGTDLNGEPFSGGANVGFADGSVRLVVQKINATLATPGWYLDNDTYRANGNQSLAWKISLP